MPQGFRPEPRRIGLVTLAARPSVDEATLVREGDGLMHQRVDFGTRKATCKSKQVHHVDGLVIVSD
ncbi:hypothetical protein RZS08_45505, partial [Arthrospira platensis SPKY1]|nr:hypothetical protein [Arthrospira platensis SPKY1]